MYDPLRPRPSPFAGTWYPGDPVELARLVDGLLDEGETGSEGESVVGLVSPHAGLVYSGAVAAAGYRRLRSEPVDTAVLLGPSHRAFFEALGVYPAGAFETPLGVVDVDARLATDLLETDARFRSMPDVHAGEHGIEMQLPFLQRLHPGCRIVPIMMGSQSRELIAAAALALADVVSRADGRVVLVASSDLSHHEPRERACALDGEVLRRLEAFDDAALEERLARNHRHACGGGPMVSVMRASRALGAERARVVRYGDSGEASGDVAAVVGYVSAVFTFTPSAAA